MSLHRARPGMISQSLSMSMHTGYLYSHTIIVNASTISNYVKRDCDNSGGEVLRDKWPKVVKTERTAHEWIQYSVYSFEL